MSSAKNKIIYSAVFLITLILTYLLLNLFFKSSSPPEPVFLKVVGFWEPEVFNVVKKDFQEKNPQITIEYEKRESENYLPSLTADLPKEDITPDVFWWHSGWGPALANHLEPLPETVMSISEYEKTFYPITKDNLLIAKTYRGFPLEIDGLALIYNKSIFASTNFREPPSTWDSLRGVYGPSLTIRDKQRILNSAIALGSVNNVENFSEIIGLFLLQNEVEFVKNGKLNILSEESAQGTNLVSDALEGYIKFNKEDKVWDNTLPNSIDAFVTGKTAMVILPAHKIHTLLQKARQANITLDFGVAPVPQLPNAKKTTWGSYWAIGVSKQSQHKEASWKLAKFLVSPEALRSVYKLESEKNDFGRAYPRVEMAKEQTTHPYLAAYLSQAPSAKNWYLHSDTKDKGLNDSLVAEFKVAMTEIERGRSASSMLKELAEKVNPILGKYNLVTNTNVK